MGLKTDIKNTIEENKKIKVHSVQFIEIPRITPNGNFKVYSVEVYVKNDKK